MSEKQIPEMQEEIVRSLRYCAHWDDHGEKCYGCERYGTFCGVNGYEKIPKKLLDDVLELLGTRYCDAQEVWELARKVAVSVQDGGFSHAEMDEIFGVESCTIAKIMDLGYEEALRRYREYQELRFQVGDEVEIDVGIGVVTKYSGRIIMVMMNNGECAYRIKTEAKKTGRHFDEVEQLLAKIGGENNDE